MTKLYSTALSLALILPLAACSGAESDSVENGVAPVALVKLATVQQGGADQLVTVYGAVEPGPLGKVALAAPVEATLVAIDAPVGTSVGRGQIIARLAASPTTRVDLTRAASESQAANAALARAQRLRADGLGSNAEVETARAASVSANALRTSLAQRTGGLTLRAPAAGVVDAITPVVGDLIQAGGAVASVARSADARVRFGIDPDLARRIHPGAALRVAGVTNRAPLPLIIQSVSPVIDPATRLASVYARVPAGYGFSPGETLTATIDTGGDGAALTIPYSALLDDAGQPFVYVVARGVAHRRDVSPEPSTGVTVTIKAGLKPGERVVTEGGTALEDGMKVRLR